MIEVNVTILGIPVIARFGIDKADPSVGLMSDVIEDLTFHNVKNGSELPFIKAKLDKAGNRAWSKAHDDIWAAFERQQGDY